VAPGALVPLANRQYTPQRKSEISRWGFQIIQRGSEKFFGTFISFFGTFISFFGTFISFFRSFISPLGGEFSFARELLGNSSGDIGRGEDVVATIALGSQDQSSYSRVVVKCS